MNMPQYNPVVPPETTRAPTPSVVIQLKNTGTTALTVADIEAKPVRIGIGETKPVRVAVKYAQRLREMQERGSPLRVINVSDIASDDDDDDDEPAPPPRRGRVRITSTATMPADDDDDDDRANRAFIEQSQKDAKRLGRRNPRQVIYPEITTPEQLLVFMQESESPMPHSELISVAHRILPEGTFREHQPNKAQIIRALETVMQRRRR